MSGISSCCSWLISYLLYLSSIFLSLIFYLWYFIFDIFRYFIFDTLSLIFLSSVFYLWWFYLWYFIFGIFICDISHFIILLFHFFFLGSYILVLGWVWDLLGVLANLFFSVASGRFRGVTSAGFTSLHHRFPT